MYSHSWLQPLLGYLSSLPHLKGKLILLSQPFQKKLCTGQLTNSRISSYLCLSRPPRHPLWWSAARLMSPWSRAPPWHSFSLPGWWLRNNKSHDKCFHRIHWRCLIFAHSSHVLPSTLWETLESRKLSGSSSSPSLSQARPFCGLPAFFWALPPFPSSSDKSLSDSARMSSILERRGGNV